MIEIPNHETLYCEFKSDKNNLPDNDIIEVVVAFANTEGGDLYLGIEDNGEITGLHSEHYNIAPLAAFIANKTVPPISVRAEVLATDPAVLRISVPKSRSIIATSSGRILRRRLKVDGMPENVPMYPYEITTRLSDLSLLDFSAQPVPDSSVNDFDPLEIDRLRKIVLSYNGEKELLSLTDDELLVALRMAVECNGVLTPTITGLLLLGKQEKIKQHIPTAGIVFQVLKGTDVKINDSIDLPMLAAFEKIQSFLSAWNPEQELELGLFRMSVPDFDKRAVREAIINAFSHRDYSMMGRVRIQISDEGMTISNPGGFIEGVSLYNLISAEPHGRNPALADALKRLGLAERTGRGIDRIYEGSLNFGRPLPDYSESTNSQVILILPRSDPDPVFVEMISDEHNRTGNSLSVYSMLILDTLKRCHRCDVIQIAEQIHISEGRVRAQIEQLVEMGLVEATGTSRNRAFVLSPKVYKATGNLPGYVRQTDIDKLRYPELAIKLAKQQGYLTKKDVVDLLHVEPAQAYRIIKDLVAQGKLKPGCKGKYAKYLPTK